MTQSLLTFDEVHEDVERGNIVSVRFFVTLGLFSFGGPFAKIGNLLSVT